MHKVLAGTIRESLVIVLLADKEILSVLVCVDFKDEEMIRIVGE